MTPRTCSENGCQSPPAGRGLCRKHYYARKHRDDLPTEWGRPTDLDRFMARVGDTDENGCWPWTGSTMGETGYGQMWMRGRPWGAHRAAYELLVGPVSASARVCHRCDVRLCVNPAHLFLGTQADNITDKTVKGRQARGADHGMAALDEDDVRAIRAAHASGERAVTLAERYGVHRTHIHSILSRRTWKHLK